MQREKEKKIESKDQRGSRSSGLRPGVGGGDLSNSLLRHQDRPREGTGGWPMKQKVPVQGCGEEAYEEGFTPAHHPQKKVS